MASVSVWTDKCTKNIREEERKLYREERRAYVVDNGQVRVREWLTLGAYEKAGLGQKLTWVNPSSGRISHSPRSCPPARTATKYLARRDILGILWQSGHPGI